MPSIIFEGMSTGTSNLNGAVDQRVHQEARHGTSPAFCRAA